MRGIWTRFTAVSSGTGALRVPLGGPGNNSKKKSESPKRRQIKLKRAEVVHFTEELADAESAWRLRQPMD